jgi:hypothetical protein
MLQDDCTAYDLVLQKVKKLDEVIARQYNGPQAVATLYPLHVLTALLKVHYMPQATKAQEVSDTYVFQKSTPFIEKCCRSKTRIMKLFHIV